MQFDSQLYGDGDGDELERNIAPRAWPLKRLTDRRSVALTAQAQCLFFSAGDARSTCAYKVVTKIADRHS